jgi:hypothetical protein
MIAILEEIVGSPGSARCEEAAYAERVPYATIKLVPLIHLV